MGIQSLLYPEQIGRLLDLYAGHPQADALVQRLFPSLDLLLKPLETVPLGISRLGGWPDLPPDFSWPSQQGVWKPFFMQWRCSQLSPDPISRLLPTSGMLYFFGYDDCSVIYLPEDQITALVPFVPPLLEEGQEKQYGLPYAPHAILAYTPRFLFCHPYSLTMRDFDLADFELISECLFPQWHKHAHEVLCSRSQLVPSSDQSIISGTLLSCKPEDAYNNHFEDRQEWLMFLKVSAYSIFECDETLVYIQQEDWLNQKYTAAYIIDTN